MNEKYIKANSLKMVEELTYKYDYFKYRPYKKTKPACLIAQGHTGLHLQR